MRVSAMIAAAALVALAAAVATEPSQQVLHTGAESNTAAGEIDLVALTEKQLKNMKEAARKWHEERKKALDALRKVREAAAAPFKEPLERLTKLSAQSAASVKEVSATLAKEKGNLAAEKASLEKAIAAAKGDPEAIEEAKQRSGLATKAIEASLHTLGEVLANAEAHHTDAEATLKQMRTDKEAAVKSSQAALDAAKADYAKQGAEWKKNIAQMQAAVDTAKGKGSSKKA